MNYGINGAWMVALALLAVEPAVADQGAVTRGVYTTGVVEREPVDQLSALPRDASRVYFYTELRNLVGQTVTHRWQQDGKTLLEVPFEVKAARWRVWSSKEIHPGVTGEWTVVVVDGKGKELKRQTLPAAQ